MKNLKNLAIKVWDYLSDPLNYWKPRWWASLFALSMVLYASIGLIITIIRAF